MAPRGPAGGLVIAHGYGEHGGAYRRVAEALSGRADLDVIAVDFRGHGRAQAGAASWCAVTTS